MPIFEVSARKVVTTLVDDTVEASDRREATKMFKEKYPDLRVEFVDEENGEGSNVVGQDESTLEYIFDDDDYHTDSDGCMTLFKTPEERAQWEKEMAESD